VLRCQRAEDAFFALHDRGEDLFDALLPLLKIGVARYRNSDMGVVSAGDDRYGDVRPLEKPDLFAHVAIRPNKTQTESVDILVIDSPL
jgi:hypothetical protein